jgi:hypothetical protein
MGNQFMISSDSEYLRFRNMFAIFVFNGLIKSFVQELKCCHEAEKLSPLSSIHCYTYI